MKIQNNIRKTASVIMTALVIGSLLLTPTMTLPSVNGQISDSTPEKTFITSNSDKNKSQDMRFLHDPSLTKKGFVPTPMGYLPSECVFHVGNNALINRDNTVNMSNGTHLVLPDCKNDPKIIAAQSAAQNSTYPSTSGWVEYAAECYCPTSPPAISYFTGKWTVPPVPFQLSSQIIFLFNGLQASSISSYPLIQPVLQWGETGQFWAIDSWWCNPDQFTCSSALAYQTSAGKTITGTMTGSNCDVNAACDWTIATTDGTNTSTLSFNSPTGLYWMDAAVLEGKNVVNCGQYPPRGATPTVFNSFTVRDTNGQTLTPSWTGTVNINDGCQEQVDTSQPNQVSLYYGDS